MKYSSVVVACGSAILISACGGSSNDHVAPVMDSLSSTMVAPATLRITSQASDNSNVTGYCFQSSSTRPQSSDLCFQESNYKDFDLTLPLSLQHVWAKDAQGNVSNASLRGPCSVQGIGEADARAPSTPSVCMMTSMGELVFALNSNEAPLSVNNFLNYVNDGFYAGTVFHRVISTFMIQGGGFDEQGQAKVPTYAPIELEATSSTGLSNTEGTLAMARSDEANSATSQFFVNVVDNDKSLDTGNGGYAVFGRVISGFDTVNAIKGVPVQASATGETSSPLDPPVIHWAIQLQ